MTHANDIRSALETAISGVVGIPNSSNRAWENVTFSPTTGVMWVKISIIPFMSRPAVMGPSPAILHTGLFVVDIFAPEKTGASVAETLADQVRTVYNVDNILTSGAATVRFRYSERGQGLPESPWFHIPVTAEWYSYEITA